MARETFRDLVEAKIRGNPDEITEASLSHFYQAWENSGTKTFSILTSWRGGELSIDQNKANLAELKSLLRSWGYGYIPTTGGGIGWGNEPSLFVPGITKDHVADILHRYNQAAVIYGGPDTDGQAVILLKSGEVKPAGSWYPHKGENWTTWKDKDFTFEAFASGWGEALVEQALRQGGFQMTNLYGSWVIETAEEMRRAYGLPFPELPAPSLLRRAFYRLTHRFNPHPWSVEVRRFASLIVDQIQVVAQIVSGALRGRPPACWTGSSSFSKSSVRQSRSVKPAAIASRGAGPTPVRSRELPMPEGEDKAANTGPQEMQFEFIKSNQFRVVHVDGIWGGATPSAKIFLSFWHQRFPIPTKVHYVVDQDKQEVKEIGREGRTAVVRELEVGCIMDIEIAVSLMSFLQTQLEQLGVMANSGGANAGGSDSKD